MNAVVPDHSRLTERYTLRGELVCETAVHVGTGAFPDVRAASDMPVAFTCRACQPSPSGLASAKARTCGAPGTTGTKTSRRSTDVTSTEPHRKRKNELLRLAYDLALELAEGGARRGEWRYVLDALYLAPYADPRRRDEARDFVEALPDSWLRHRSKQSGRQLRQVRSTFRHVMREGYGDEELRFLLGWTARILDTNEKERKREEKAKKEGKWTPRTPRTEKAKPPQARTEPGRETWRAAMVSYEAGNGVVRASSAGKTAEALKDDSKRLIDKLSPEARERMVERKKRKSIKADVEVERVGRSWRLVAVREEQ